MKQLGNIKFILAMLTMGSMVSCGVSQVAATTLETPTSVIDTQATVVSPVVKTNYPINIACASSGQICATKWSATVNTTSVLKLQYATSASHCSDVRIRVLVDGVLKNTSGFLTPGTSTPTYDVTTSAGNHLIEVQAEGRVGGCNTGTLGGWAGTMIVQTSNNTDISKDFSAAVYCTNTSQLCGNKFSMPITTVSEKTLSVKYTSPPSHCADVRLNYYVDGIFVKATDFVQPGEMTPYIDLIKVGVGNHTVQVEAEGRIRAGTCNAGTLQSWAGAFSLLAKTI
jgi:hypothetical protein